MGVYIYFLLYIIVFIVLTITTIKDNKKAYEKYDLDGAKLRLKRLKIIMAIQIIISISIFSFFIHYVLTYYHSSCLDDEYIVDEIEMQKMEIELQNAIFNQYNKIQSGSTVLNFLDSCRANANANRDSEEKVPTIKFLDDGNKQIVIAYESNNISEYMNSIKEIKNCISKDHRYEISLEYNEIGFVSEITITY